MRKSLRTKSNLLFIQIVTLGSTIFLLSAGIIFKIYKYIFPVAGEFVIKKAEVACGCKTVISGSNATLTGILTFIGATLVVSILFAIARVIFSTIKTNKFLKIQQINLVKKSLKLTHTTEQLGITNRVEEIETDLPTIFCHGIIKPKICISSKVVDLLNFSELRAVLKHETQHMTSWEPARLLIIKFINTFRFIPGIKNLTEKYLSFSELAADEMATNNFTEKINLAKAMGKILALEQKTIMQKGLALSYFSQITEERVRTLSENNYTPTFKKEVLKVAFGVAIAAIIFFYFPSQIQAQTNYKRPSGVNSLCANQEYKNKSCVNLWTNCENKKFKANNADRSGFVSQQQVCENYLPYLKGDN